MSDYANAKNLKDRLQKNVKDIIQTNSEIKGKEYSSSFILEKTSMNFNQKSFDNIQAHPDWAMRTEKMHSKSGESVPDNTREMQSCNSSDALLMNIFCYPDFPKWEGPKKLLGLSGYPEIQFGWNPQFSNEKDPHRTEIDLKIGDTIFEAKLTEADFTQKETAKVEAYPDFSRVFENVCLLNKGKYDNYQLIRNFLTAYQYDYAFILLVDESRTDLIRHFYDTVLAVKDAGLQKRLRFITWQELINECGEDLKEYIFRKYF